MSNERERARTVFCDARITADIEGRCQQNIKERCCWLVLCSCAQRENGQNHSVALDAVNSELNVTVPSDVFFCHGSCCWLVLSVSRRSVLELVRRIFREDERDAINWTGWESWWVQMPVHVMAICSNYLESRGVTFVKQEEGTKMLRGEAVRHYFRSHSYLALKQTFNGPPPGKRWLLRRRRRLPQSPTKHFATRLPVFRPWMERSGLAMACYSAVWQQISSIYGPLIKTPPQHIRRD